jgi:hypothetical protein
VRGWRRGDAFLFRFLGGMDEMVGSCSVVGGQKMRVGIAMG